MKTQNKLFLWAALCVIPLGVLWAAGSTAEVISKTDGLHVTTKTSDRVAFHDAAPVAQRSGAAQATLVDSTTGTAGTAIAAGVGRSTITIPVSSLATGLSTAAIDVATNYTPGYRFKILKFDFVTTIAGTGTGASQVFNLEVGSTNVTGGVLTVNLASTDTIGEVTVGTNVTAANVGTALDNISIEMAASGTVFTAGGGYFVIEIQNMDTADAHASEIRMLNELRDALVQKGLIKGGS